MNRKDEIAAELERRKEYVISAGLFETAGIMMDAAAALRASAAPEEGRNGPVVSVKPMSLSGNRTDYFVSIKVGDREVTPHAFREEYKAAYHVALYDWLLNGSGEEPDVVEFGPNDWPARALPSDSGKLTCTCGQAGHGNAHEPGCPLSNYTGPTKFPRHTVLDECVKAGHCTRMQCVCSAKAFQDYSGKAEPVAWRDALEPILYFARAIPPNVQDATGMAYAPFEKLCGTAASLTAGHFRRLLAALAPATEGGGREERWEYENGNLFRDGVNVFHFDPTDEQAKQIAELVANANAALSPSPSVGTAEMTSARREAEA